MFVNIAYAVPCNSTLTDGCTILDDIVLTPGTYYLPNGIYILGSNVDLDCNGATLEGSGTGQGIRVIGTITNYTIKNCNINNFNYGIYLYQSTGTYYSYNTYQKDGIITGNTISGNNRGIYAYGIANADGKKAHIVNISITGNTITGNNDGIYFSGIVHDNLVWDNTFQDNTNSGVYIFSSASSNTVWDNDFYDTGIFYTHTDNYFCSDGTANNYYLGADGPECDCYLAYDAMTIDNDAELCLRTYNLLTGILMDSSSKLDCNGATLKGLGNANSYGVKVAGTKSNYTIENCNINNFDYGIYLYQSTGTYYPYDIYQKDAIITGNIISENNRGIYAYGGTYTGGRKAHIVNISIIGNTITNNDNGIYFSGVVHDTLIKDNSIFSNEDYNLQNNAYYNVSAEYNYWGFSNESLISETIYDYYENSFYGIVDFIPYLTGGEEESLLEKYAPVLYFHPDEQFFPTTIDAMLNESDLMESKVWFDEVIDEIPVAIESLSSLDVTDEYYFDMRGASGGYERATLYEIPDPHRFDIYSYDVYARELEPDNEHIVLQYWFFYPYNNWKNKHEGDWEMIQLILNKSNQSPISTTFSFHYDALTLNWSQAEKINTYNPKVFVA
ncbi:MAG: right-handed parallel beta-helix repeat-containing protein, partial [Nanoarchaeota archaeon]|nr:right-handed parallel beta-helix repeat-containing protein [Nanoarchaeota archaeon]